jgi:hypothetical protein
MFSRALFGVGAGLSGFFALGALVSAALAPDFRRSQKAKDILFLGIAAAMLALALAYRAAVRR